jgi:hypothetical protein
VGGALVLVALAALAAGCGTAGESSAPARTQPPVTSFEEARSAEDGMRVELGGAVYADDRPMQLCDALAESYPPQCGHGIPLAGIEWEALPAVRRASGVTWTDTGVVLSGEMRGGTLHVDGIGETRSVRAAPARPPSSPDERLEEPVTSEE